MLKSTFFKGLLGASAVAALFGTIAVQAQTSATQNPSGQSATAQGSTGSASGSTGTAGGSAGTSGSGADQGGASGASGQSGASGASGQSATQGSTASGAGGSVSKADQKIMSNLAIANMAEIEAARMAQTKSQNDQVKTFAQQMIDDHTRAMSELQNLAQSKGVTLPTEIDRQNKAKASKLAALSGDQFDKAYMAQSGVADHKKTHALLTQAQKSAKDPELKALAAKLQPTVDQHLTAAQQLHGNKGTAKGTSGTGTEKSGQ